jgi:hypothetical protein
LAFEVRLHGGVFREERQLCGDILLVGKIGEAVDQGFESQSVLDPL